MMSLRTRVVAAIAVLLFTGSLVGVALAGWQAKQVLREELAAALSGGRLTVTGAFDSLGRSDNPARDLNRLVAAFDGNRHVQAVLYDATGRLARASRPIAARAAPAWFARMLLAGPRGLTLRVPGPPGGWIVLSPVPANDVAAIWSEFIDLGAVLAASLGLGCWLVWLTVGQALRPLSDFSAAFLRIGSGDYSAAVRAAGPSELVRLGRGVNDMAGRLAAMQARTHRLEDQLRTLQDEERADLARDLHDEIGPHLFAVNVDAAMARRLIAEGHTAEAVKQVEAIQEAVAHMQRLVRDILGRLRPTELIELGLKAAIEALVTFWSARHPAIVFRVDVPDDEALPLADDARETLYRVVQEGLNNAVRHGRPGRIEIEVARLEGGEVLARVTDDGAAGAKPGVAGFGLRGMRERVAAAGGGLSVGRGPKGGWSVMARLAASPRGEDFAGTAPEPTAKPAAAA
jgi:two-component system sensor histidine kinase UhpB